MKRLRRHKTCLNCQTPLPDNSYNFCPTCGQANTNNRVSLRELWHDLFDNYISLDSRMGHTIVPFLFQPGKLTQEFSRGKRIHYTHPLKLYLITSLLFFFAFSHLAMPELNRELVDWQRKLDEQAKNATVRQENNDLPISAEKSDSTEKPIQFSITFEDSEGVERNAELGSLARFYHLASRRDLDTKAFIDSLEIEPSGPKGIELALGQQLQKVFRNDVSIFLSSIIQNTPIVMLVIIPFLAFIMKLFYWQKGYFYVEHLVLSLHWQAFVYFALALALVCSNLNQYWAVSLIALLTILYSVLLLQRFYRQHWLLSVLKLGFVGIFYTLTLSFSLSINALVSFFLF